MTAVNILVSRKVTERVVSGKLQDQISVGGPVGLPLLRSVPLLFLLDLTVPFDAINHGIHLDQHCKIGIKNIHSIESSLEGSLFSYAVEFHRDDPAANAI